MPICPSWLVEPKGPTLHLLGLLISSKEEKKEVNTRHHKKKKYKSKSLEHHQSFFVWWRIKLPYQSFKDSTLIWKDCNRCGMTCHYFDQFLLLGIRIMMYHVGPKLKQHYILLTTHVPTTIFIYLLQKRSILKKWRKAIHQICTFR